MPFVTVYRHPELLQDEDFDKPTFNAGLRAALVQHWSAPGHHIDPQYIDIHHRERDASDETGFALVVVAEMDERQSPSTPDGLAGRVSRELAAVTPQGARVAFSARLMHESWTVADGTLDA